MKRLLQLLTAAAIGLLVWALYVDLARSPDEGVRVVRFLDGPDVGGAWGDVIDEFERFHPDIRVEREEGPAATSLREDMYATAFSAGTPTWDLVYMDVIWVPRFAQQGWVVPIDDRLAAEDRADFLPGDIEGSTWESRLYRLPVRSDAGVLFYRKDLLDAAGEEPPKTWEDLERVSTRVARPPELWGFVFQGKPYEGLVCAFLEVLWGAGGEVIDDRGNVRIADERAIAALEWLVSLVREKGIAPGSVTTYQEEEARQQFQEGRVVLMRNWPGVWTRLEGEESSVAGKVGVCAMVTRDGRESATVLGGWGFGIAANARDRDAAWKFAQFAASPEAQAILHRRSAAVPSRRSLYEDEGLLAESPLLADLEPIVLRARPRPVDPRWARISDILSIRLSAALVGQETPRQALDRAAEEIRSLGAPERSLGMGGE